MHTGILAGSFKRCAKDPSYLGWSHLGLFRDGLKPPSMLFELGACAHDVMDLHGDYLKHLEAPFRQDWLKEFGHDSFRLFVWVFQCWILSSVSWLLGRNCALGERLTWLQPKAWFIAARLQDGPCFCQHLWGESPASNEAVRYIPGIQDGSVNRCRRGPCRQRSGAFNMWFYSVPMGVCRELYIYTHIYIYIYNEWDLIVSLCRILWNWAVSQRCQPIL